MANSKRVRIVITNPPAGCQSHTSLDRARRYVSRGRAEWVAGALRFLESDPGAALAQQPTIDAIVPGILDAGGSCARYPQPMQTTVFAKWPALSRHGAGMAA